MSFGITGTRNIFLGLQIQVQKYDQMYYNNTDGLDFCKQRISQKYFY